MGALELSGLVPWEVGWMREESATMQAGECGWLAGEVGRADGAPAGVAVACGGPCGKAARLRVCIDGNVV